MVMVQQSLPITDIKIYAAKLFCFLQDIGSLIYLQSSQSFSISDSIETIFK